jgi:hypothetical protein
MSFLTKREIASPTKSAIEETQTQGEISQVISDAVRLDFSHYTCNTNCSCICHRRTHFRTPQVLAWLTGSLSVGYSGLPSLQLRCNRYECRGNSSLNARVSYFFPRWLLQWGVAASFSSKPTPQVSLRTSRIRSSGDDIFTLCHNGDIKQIRTLFVQGAASPNDVTHCHRYSLLTVSKPTLPSDLHQCTLTLKSMPYLGCKSALSNSC